MKNAIMILAGAFALAASAREPLMVTLTFDDSTADHVIAAKSLEKRGWKGSFNVITGWIGRKGSKGSRKGEELTWDQIRAIHKAGHQVNSHTVNHVHLATLAKDGKLDEVRREVAESKAAIARELGVAPRYLCHPFVQFSPEVNNIILEEGMLPMTDLRINFGGGDNDPGTEKDLGHTLDKWYAEGVKARDLMFHGIDNAVGVWRPFKTLADWEATLDMLQERERKGIVKVLNYDEFYEYAKKVGEAPPEVMKMQKDAFSDITWDTFGSYAKSNVEYVKDGSKVRGILIEHHGCGDQIDYRPLSPLVIGYAKEGILHLTPRTDPWCWMNDRTIAFCDRLIDVLISHYKLPRNVKVISKGGSMGGMGAIVYARYSRHNIAAVVSVCPVTDLPFRFAEPHNRACILPAYMDAPDLQRALMAHSPMHLVDSLPDVPYWIFHTTGDSVVSREKHVEPFVEAMKKRGRRIAYDLGEGGGHCKLLDDQLKRSWYVWKEVL